MWPTAKAIDDFGSNWHRLELIQCFEVPDTIDLPDLYGDKSHSMQRSEVLNHVSSKPDQPVPTRRIMTTLLEFKTLNVSKFLQELNDNGISWEDCIIGLMAKERELKNYGRFYSLMSWVMRTYFVVTEYLIKKHYVPLFAGLTMADDRYN